MNQRGGECFCRSCAVLGDVFARAAHGGRRHVPRGGLFGTATQSLRELGWFESASDGRHSILRERPAFEPPLLPQHGRNGPSRFDTQEYCSISEIKCQSRPPYPDCFVRSISVLWSIDKRGRRYPDALARGRARPGLSYPDSQPLGELQRRIGSPHAAVGLKT